MSNTTEMRNTTKTEWHVVQSVNTGLYQVVRGAPGASQDDDEFLCGVGGAPRQFKSGEIADIAADKANNPWKYACWA